MTILQRRRRAALRKLRRTTNRWLFRLLGIVPWPYRRRQGASA